MNYRNSVKFYLLLLSPGLLLLFFFTYFPFFKATADSLHDFRMQKSGQTWVAFGNYKWLFTDANFIAALYNNLIYTVCTMIPGMLLALLFALTLNKNTVFNRILRAIFFLPTIIPLVAAAALWSFIFLSGIGLFDYYLGKIVGYTSHNLPGNEHTALMALMALSDPAKQVLTIGLVSFTTSAEAGSEWGLIAAGTLMICLPLIVAFIFFQKTFISSFGFTELK